MTNYQELAEQAKEDDCTVFPCEVCGSPVLAWEITENALDMDHPRCPSHAYDA